jgi:hypothetical protein
MRQMRTTHAQTISPIWKRRVSSFFHGSYGRFSKNVYGCQLTHTTATQKYTERTKETQTQTDRQTDRQTEIHTHTHTHTHLGAGVQHVGHILVVPIMKEAQVLHTQVPTRRKQMRLHVDSPLG